MTLNVGAVITDIYARMEKTDGNSAMTLRNSVSGLPRLRIGHQEKSVLSFLLKNGAKTSYELALKIEGFEITDTNKRTRTRAKSFF
jgi:hypothetical protein